MVSASSRIAAADALARLTAKPANSTNKSNSFSQQFTGAIKGHINQSLDGSRASIGGGDGASQNSAKSQVLVAGGSKAEAFPTMLGMGPVAGTPPVIAKASSAGSVAIPAEEIPTMLGMGPAAANLSGVLAVAAKVPVARGPAPQPIALPTTETEADAYWAGQPAALQVLRGMPDSEAKEKLALNLANQGYSVDTQIMVWNWDPQMTMQVRENQGYSWVPSFGQSNIPIGPGLSMPGVPNSYSPNSPPAGSVSVSTAFAIGTILNPLVQVDPTTT